MAQEPVIQIWTGESNFSPGDTPYGFFDTDPQFILDVDKFAKWSARKLGYPIVDIELVSENFYAAYEQAVADYSSFVNEFQARDNLISLSGMPTGSLRLEQQYIKPTLTGMFKLSEAYATEIGISGNLVHYTGSINIVPNQQVYSLKNPIESTLEKGDFNTDNFTIRRVFIESLDMTARYNSGNGLLPVSEFGLLNEFGWADMAMTYTLMPLNYDLQKLQAVEMSNQIRGSQYGFHLTADRIRIFPIPRKSMKIWFNYTLDDENIDLENGNVQTGLISDYSNIPYHNKLYTNINDIGKNWIRKYAHALVMEMLGFVRSKYDSIPMTLDTEISLNGQDLLSQAQNDKDSLVQELRETLEGMSRQALLERQMSETDALAATMAKLPLKIYVK